MPTPFTKTQGAGNDFIVFDLAAAGAVFDLTAAGADLTAAGVDWEALAPRLCDRHFGIGADGLLLVLPSTTADFRMRVINSDGSEPEMCGNGLRCFVRYLHDRGHLRGSQVTVETGAGVLAAEVIPADAGLRVRLDMGKPEFLGEGGLPLPDRILPVTLISMGNPHCVSFVSDLDALPFETLGPLVERHARFPERINAEFSQVLDRRHVRVMVWERGAGPTLACGTGACAVAVAAAAQGLTERQVTVSLPGGDLDIDWREDGHVFLTGPAEVVFSGEVDLASLRAPVGA